MSEDRIHVPDWMVDADHPVAEQIVAAIIMADEILQGNVENLEDARDEMVKVLTEDTNGTDDQELAAS